LVYEVAPIGVPRFVKIRTKDVFKQNVHTGVNRVGGVSAGADFLLVCDPVVVRVFLIQLSCLRSLCLNAMTGRGNRCSVLPFHAAGAMQD
jgi:hypothetical protein